MYFIKITLNNHPIISKVDNTDLIIVKVEGFNKKFLISKSMINENEKTITFPANFNIFTGNFN